LTAPDLAASQNSAGIGGIAMSEPPRVTRERIIESVRVLNDLQDVARAVSVATKLMTKRLETVEMDLVELLCRNETEAPLSA
jgi:hypothetical protein